MGKKGNTARDLRAAILDFCVFALLLAGLNALLANGDPLFINTHPNPWLLLPVYLGCRYGFAAGCVSGILIAALAATIVTGKDDLTIQEALGSQRFLLLGFLVGGLLTGAVRSLLNRQMQALEFRATVAEEENARLQSEHDALDETRHQLQQRLALLGAETCALDQQLRALFAPAAGPVLPACLTLLRSAAHASSSCVIEFDSADPGGGAKVIAALDSQWKQGDVIPSEQLAIARAAIDDQAAVTWKADNVDHRNHVLAAIPWSRSISNNVVVLVEDMPFTAISHSAFSRIEMIVRWVARYLPAPSQLSESQKASITSQFVSVDEFESQGQLAQETFDRLRIPSVIAEFEDSEFSQTMSDHSPAMKLLRAALQEQVRAPRVACMATDSGQFRVLLPMESKRDAENFTAALLQPLEAAGNVSVGRIRHQLIEIGRK
jgi:hypothetical protein